MTSTTEPSRGTREGTGAAAGAVTAAGARTAGRVDLSAVEHLITAGEVDGIPALWAPREGPITAALVFRVGRADETLATAGITHLVEHLALFRLNLSEPQHNGATADTYTVFHVTGTAVEVVDHLNGVCAALRDLPLDRLETEKEILRTEAAGQGGRGARVLRVWRHGATDHGLLGYDELGTYRVTPDEVQEWARARFTAQNAVLFVTSGSLPPGLDLRLPAGTRRPTPAPSLAMPQLPAFVHGDDGAVALDAIVGRSTAASVFTEVAARALFRDLRQEGGLSYVADGDYSPIDGDLARITLYADALADKQDAVTAAFVDTMARLRRVEVSDADLAAARSRLLKGFDTPELGASLLPSIALNVLLGYEVRSPDQIRAEIEATTAAHVREVAQAVWDGALWLVPGRGIEWAGPVAAPSHSPTPAVEGRVLPRHDDPSVALVVGGDGVSLTAPGGANTVRFDDVVAMTTRPDGARTLFDREGFVVSVEPTLHRGLTAEVIRSGIDAHVPGRLVVPLPARDPDRIPEPGPRVSRAASGAGGRAKAPSRFVTWLMVVGMAVSVLVVSIVLVIALDLPTGLSGGVGVGIGLLGRSIYRTRHPKTPKGTGTATG